MCGKSLRQLLLVTLLFKQAVACPNHCSGNGICRGLFCDCDDGYQGGDCSERRCPMAHAWVDVASAIDTAHAPAECSNMGSCDRALGVCRCKPGFDGPACERLRCPGLKEDCNGHGVCVSLAEAAEDAGVAYSLWDRHRIVGCSCEEGWTEYDCSLRSCPSGDDPQSTGQLAEVQTITCTGDTSGTFALRFRGPVHTARLTGAATLDDLRTNLQALPSITEVDVTFPSGSALTASDALCDSAGRDVEVHFTTQHGDLPLLRVFASSGLTSLTVAETVKGTKEDEPCNGRGFCMSDPSSNWGGLCRCVDSAVQPHPISHRVYLVEKHGSSDGKGVDGAPGTTGDCGLTLSTFDNQCPTANFPGKTTTQCSGHGACDASTYRCTCTDGWMGHNCEFRTCPSGDAWYSVPSVADIAHLQMECSNRGICNRKNGLCACQDNFEGIACERFSCPSISGKVCSEYGTCGTMAEIAKTRRVNGELSATVYGSVANVLETWDAHKIQGCICSGPFPYANMASDGAGHVPQWTGHDCSVRMCPSGPRPAKLTESCTSAFETQTMTCTADPAGGATLTATFRDQTTDAVFGPGVLATGEGSLQVHLEGLSSIGRVNVSYTNAASGVVLPGTTGLCSTDGSVVASVTFLTELGDLPALSMVDTSSSATATVTAAELVKGTKSHNLECADRGLCDRGTGLCKCFHGYTSGDGDGGRGTRGDCGFQDAFAK